MFAKLEKIGNADAADEFAKQYFAENMAQYLRDNLSVADARLVIRFFDEVWICVDQNLCDEASARAFFEDDAYQLFLALGSEIQRIQRTQPRFGIGLESLRISTEDGA